MGFMMTFTQYEYIQYTNRTVFAENSKGNAIPRSNRIQPIPFLRKSEPAFYMGCKQGYESKRRQQIRPEAVDRTMSDITGLGKYMNLSI